MSTDTRKYGRAKCWFNHKESENVKEDVNNEKLMKCYRKLFIMMETFTNQIVKMKETNNLE